MFTMSEVGPPTLGLGGLDTVLTDEQTAVRDSAHRFAKDVMRPIGRELDRLSPEAAIADSSPLWSFATQIRDSGLLDLSAIAGMDTATKLSLFPLLFEELGWGDAGLTIFALATAFPAFTAYATGEKELIDRFGGEVGCWVATQPDRGSDTVDLRADQADTGAKQNRGNLLAKMEASGDVVLNGQSSAWVSGGPVAKCGLVYAPCDYGDGVERDDGSLNYIAMLVPFDEGGVSKGKPLDKIGQRPLPQGEIIFDNVRVPKRYVVADAESAYTSWFAALTFGNMEMAMTFTGVARSAFDHALEYVHERRQGGVPIIQHQSVKARIFDMFRKIEAGRALADRVMRYNYSDNGPHIIASITGKTFVTNTAHEVANEAIQLFGGNGLTSEYPVEKIMRDARAAQIEDGENNILTLMGATWLSRGYTHRNGMNWSI